MRLIAREIPITVLLMLANGGLAREFHIPFLLRLAASRCGGVGFAPRAGQYLLIQPGEEPRRPPGQNGSRRVSATKGYEICGLSMAEIAIISCPKPPLRKLAEPGDALDIAAIRHCAM